MMNLYPTVKVFKDAFLLGMTELRCAGFDLDPIPLTESSLATCFLDAHLIDKFYIYYYEILE